MTSLTGNGQNILTKALADRSGAALVEFTLVIFFLMALMLGTMEFGRFLYQYQLVVEGLRDAARYLARVDPSVGANQTNAKNLATTGTIDGSGGERVAGWVAGDVNVDFLNPVDPSLYRGLDPIHQVVNVSTTFNYADLGLLSFFDLGPLTPTVAQEQRVIRE